MEQPWNPGPAYRFVINPFRGGYMDGFDRERPYRFLRYGDTSPRVFRLCDQGPLFNVANLYFAPLPASIRAPQ